MTTAVKTLNKMHIIAMARHAGLVIQDDNAVYLNDLAGEKELIAFARLIERAARNMTLEGMPQPAEAA